MNAPLSRSEVRDERDVAGARERARAVADRLGFGARDRARIGAAVAVVALDALRRAGGGTIEFRLEGDPARSLASRVVIPPPGVLGLVEAGRPMPDAVGVAALRRTAAPSSRSPGPSPSRTSPLASPSWTRRPSARSGPALGPSGPVDELIRQDQELIRAARRRLRDREAEAGVRRAATWSGPPGASAPLGLQASTSGPTCSARPPRRRRGSTRNDEATSCRAPLDSILGLARLLLDRADGELSAEQERQVGFILLAALDLNGMFDDLLDLARIEAGREVVRAPPRSICPRPLRRPAPGSPGSTRSGAPGLRRSRHGLRGARVGLPAVVTDEAKLSRVLENFLSNALKFTERGEVRLKAEPGPGDSVVFSVADTGIGIEPGHLERVFEEFGQVDGPLQRLVKGSGLGLPLVRKLAQAPSEARSNARSQPEVDSGARLDPSPAHRPAAPVAGANPT